MNQSLFWLTNKTSTKQTVELFNTSDQSGKSTTSIWNFAGDFSGVFDGSKWFKSATINPTLRLEWYRADGATNNTTTSSPSLINCDLADVVAQLNSGFLATFGTWTGEETGGTNAKFTCVLKNPVPTTFTGGVNPELGQQGAILLRFFDDVASVTITAADNPENFYEGLVDNKNVEITSYSNFSYNEFLWSVIQRTYNVTNFQVWSATKSQLFEPFLFDRKTAAGRTYQRVAAPIMDPYQMQNTVNTEYLEGYLLDGFTSLKYTIDPSAKLRLVMDYTYTDIATPLLLRRYGNVYKRLNLFMPSPDFVKRQFPSQPGVLKLLGENDFPLEEW